MKPKPNDRPLRLLALANSTHVPRVAADGGDYELIVDVRSPGEYVADHIPGAINLPVLDDVQRAEVGTLYAASSFEARRLGASLVAANLAVALADKRVRALPYNARVLVYCWRGGERSNSLAHTLVRVGFAATLLEGGYNAYRAVVRRRLAALDGLCCCVVTGRTGVGKGEVLDALGAAGAQTIDLEGLAGHRGSALGAIPGASQPSQKAFESALDAAVAALPPTGGPVFVEGESITIGSRSLPPSLFRAMAAAPAVEISLPLAPRVARLREGYAHYETEGGAAALRATLRRSLAKMHGHAVVNRWCTLIEERRWDEFVEAILLEHYDPAYDKAYARDRHGAAAAAKAPGTRAALSDLSVALPSAEPVAYAAAAAQIVTWLKRRKEGCPAPDATSV